ncbi:hypothetical protein D9758_015368 [Tetrapyrgos nigripes]|uniref:Heterokaryon incompatibility domain-containing protein n=1 Tax=Tetrapyrgos nigripes TaxID=182062 RepID=A0A8H5CA95_9AGAR|nr:hypothetical protein D9758_015368 [Tetrapyrgos nigripes]
MALPSFQGGMASGAFLHPPQFIGITRIPNPQCFTVPAPELGPSTHLASPAPICKRAKPRRLLNTNTLQLEEFPFNNIVPPYAILSHRWEGNQEISYLQMLCLKVFPPDVTLGILRRKGLLKIVYACVQAIKDGYSYIWIDTCCINDSNIGQKSEDINSMYEYYRSAGVCYVYLNDVNPSPSNCLTSTSLNAMTDSSWFSRGWTLQELVAPSIVKFFSADWKYLGEKKDFVVSEIIACMTGIPSDVLQGSRSVGDVDIKEKIAWSINRSTTKEEDQAYCLLGLLGVTMEPRYGEGVEEAFTRLYILLNFRYPLQIATLVKTYSSETGNLNGQSILKSLPSCNQRSRNSAMFGIVSKSHSLITEVTRQIYELCKSSCG